MFNWAKSALSVVAGTAEPIYGPDAIQSVEKQTESTSYTELARDDMKWVAMESTSVETQVFYLMADSGHIGVAQVIYSNVAGLRTTCQFTTKVFYPKEEKKANLWSSKQLNNIDFSEDKTAFYADDVAVELAEDGKSYSVKSMTDENAIVNITIKQAAPGFVAGKDGKTNFGTDPEAPWGAMRHAFWPRNTVEGTIVTPDGPIDFKGKGLFIHALQAGKPHHLAAAWNFANFQGPNYTAVLMHFKTPESYAFTNVAVGGIIKDGEIVAAGCNHYATHTKVKEDPDNNWEEPEAVKYNWSGKTKDGKELTAILEADLEEKRDRIDIMVEVPGFVKNIVAAAAGTKPYIYQYSQTAEVKIKIGDQEITEQGKLFAEATFIC